MSKNLLEQVKLISKTYDIFPQKSKGQNFLIDVDVLEDIVSAANLNNQDTVLEVGPGLGILTEQLVKNAKKVISIELDKRLYNFLKTQFIGTKNLELINEDILRFQPSSHGLKNYKIVANLPYNITSTFLKKFLTIENKPTDMTLLVQKEVAERMCAGPGQMSLLGLSIQLYSSPEIISLVKAKSFWPAPKVDSAIIKLSSIKSKNEVDKALGGVTEKRFWQIAKVGFFAKRKQLQNNLSSGLHISTDEAINVLEKAKFDPKIRAQNLSVDDWITLANLL